MALLELVNEYGANVDEDTLETLKQNAQSVNEEKEISNEIDKMLEAVDFKIEDSSSSWKEYTTILENTTSTNFEGFNLNIKLLDKDGVTIANETASTTNWNTGEKVKFNFSTDEEFSEIKWEWEYYN